MKHFKLQILLVSMVKNPMRKKFIEFEVKKAGTIPALSTYAFT